jgi:hypothetical protein
MSQDAIRPENWQSPEIKSIQKEIKKIYYIYNTVHIQWLTLVLDL